MQVAKHFILEEFVPEELYKQFGDKSIWFMDHRIFGICDYLREKLNCTLVINNWFLGGSFNNSGFRMPDTTVGGKLSQHKRGAAVDLHCVKYTPEQIHSVIHKNKKELMNRGLTTLEDYNFTKTWTHIDVRYTGLDDILIVRP